MKSITAALAAEKNKLYSDGTWAVLLEAQAAQGALRFFITNNEEPITFGGNVYQPFPLAIGEGEESSEGDLPNRTITISNISREVQAFLEHYQGMIDEKVVLRVVNTKTLVSSIPEEMYVDGVEATAETATFTLSTMPFLQREYPPRRFLRGRCMFAFGSGECGWGFTLGVPGINPPAGVAPSHSCDKGLNTPNGCVAHGQMYIDGGQSVLNKWPDRFGGFPTIPSRRVG